MVVEFSHCGWEKKKWDGKKKSCYILGDVYRSGFAFKTQRKKTTTFLCSYLLVLTFSVSFEN